MLENTAFLTHQNFYPKPRPKLKDTAISEETKEKFEELRREFDDISKNASDIGTCPLAEMSIDTIPGSLPAASKPYKKNCNMQNS